MNVPWDPHSVTITVTKHFATDYMRPWGWDLHDVRDAIVHAYKIERVGSTKYEIYVSKSGFKKLITVYFGSENELRCITGSEGGKRL